MKDLEVSRVQPGSLRKIGELLFVNYVVKPLVEKGVEKGGNMIRGGLRHAKNAFSSLWSKFSSTSQPTENGSQNAAGNNPPPRENNDDQSSDHEDYDSISDESSETSSDDYEKYEKAQKALRKYKERVKNRTVSGGSYTQVYTNTFKPTAGVLETNHVIPVYAYKNTPYAKISRRNMPVIIMQRQDHMAIRGIETNYNSF